MRPEREALVIVAPLVDGEMVLVFALPEFVGAE